MDSEHRKPWRWDRPGRRTPRCAEVLRELAAPTRMPLPAELAEHLASCPLCASWSRRAAALDRLWEATRPPMPPASSWNTLWAEVARAAESRPALEAVLTIPTRRLVPRLALLGAVAAAATLLVAVLILSRFDDRTPQVAHRAPPPATLDQHFEVEPGQLLTLHLDDQGVQADCRPQEQTSETETVPWDLDLYNGVESLTMASQW